MARADEGWQPVYRVVKRIPFGRVSTYGAVAALAGMPRAARQVGWALNALDEEDDVPWHRVINAKGEVSTRGAREIEGLQRALLEAEGVEFNATGRVDLGVYGWQPGARPGPRSRGRGEARSKPRPRVRKRAKQSAARAPRSGRKTTK